MNVLYVDVFSTVFINYQRFSTSFSMVFNGFHAESGLLLPTEHHKLRSPPQDLSQSIFKELQACATERPILS